MRVALSIMLMQECCNFICQWENEPGGVPIRIKHLLHSSVVSRWKQDLHGARMDSRPEEASLLQDRS